MSTEVAYDRARDGGPDAIRLPDGRRIAGFVDAGFGPVMDAFVANFVERHDLGAGCTVYRGGRPVVDVWGGIADPRSRRAWSARTVAVVFSCSKGILAICVYLLVQAGRLALDEPIMRWWPHFGAHGKSSITLRHAMSHRAGLAALDRDLTRDDILAWTPVIRAIENQRPRHAPAEGHVYHPMTYGWIVGEVIRRVTGLTPGRYLRKAVGERLDLRTWIGLPDGERATLAWMSPPLPDEDSPMAHEIARLASEDPELERSTTMGGAFAFPVADGVVTFNDPRIQAAEIPGANGISSPHSLARLYAATVSAVGGTRLLSRASIEDALRVQSDGRQLSGIPDDGSRWGTGFQLASPPSQPMLGYASFGHAGAGGQLAFADAEQEIGFAYVSNQMGGFGDRRARELTLALRASIGA